MQKNTLANNTFDIFLFSQQLPSVTTNVKQIRLWMTSSIQTAKTIVRIPVVQLRLALAVVRPRSRLINSAIVLVRTEVLEEYWDSNNGRSLSRRRLNNRSGFQYIEIPNNDRGEKKTSHTKNPGFTGVFLIPALKQSAPKKFSMRGERVRRPAAPSTKIPCLSWTRIA